MGVGASLAPGATVTAPGGFGVECPFQRGGKGAEVPRREAAAMVLCVPSALRNPSTCLHWEHIRGGLSLAECAGLPRSPGPSAEGAPWLGQCCPPKRPPAEGLSPPARRRGPVDSDGTQGSRCSVREDWSDGRWLGKPLPCCCEAPWPPLPHSRTPSRV